MPAEEPHYMVVVDDGLLRQADDFRFENRFPSRSTVTLGLIHRGTEQLRKEQETPRRDSGRE